MSQQREVAEFVALAQQYCQLIEDRSRNSVPDFLREMLRLLPRLYAAACSLSEPDCRSGEPVEREISHDQWMTLFIHLKKTLGQWDHYQSFVDVYDLEEEPSTGSLADDLADVYRDLKNGLLRWDKAPGPADRADIILDWLLDFRGHWGDHALSASRAIHAVVHSQGSASLDGADV